MRELPHHLPLLLLVIVALVTVQGSSPGAPALEQLLEQLAFWNRDDSARVSGPVARPGAETEDRSLAVVIYALDPSWWALEAAVREQEAGQFLSVLLEAKGKHSVELNGVIGLEWTEPGFALILEHENPAALTAALRQLARLSASSWFRRTHVFLGKVSLDAEPQSSPQERAAADGSESGATAIMLEERSTEWFLLSPEKQGQLLGPCLEDLSGAVRDRAVVCTSFGPGSFSTLLLLQGIGLAELGQLELELRSNWEQKYVQKRVVYAGTTVSVSKLLSALR
jgi:hypothetical protein